ncbi:long-chain-fatty-acid--CoA ligase FadD [Staphylococcus simiae]|uniref:Putative long chain fatty acid-CoA ligase VraA n=1 Tax=Staphylococcus simiae CCM 7213 = CCUG 51256 TaxID=911238 RepID=G5JIG6_9STAP|nr:class I adenylate-forming enzyme family protein [Staphylococcus simiae]EHJ08057.1 acyl-CoA synthetase FadE [Staphylococcus simiae CCM 7213 = CCUG 51256]PNZ14576.1 long-chain fatty acid--CoA ligase [Staphylococcus simiae]SNV58177.1 long-chain-fatty-acid--CoA ligase [Staphylococcus simiae]
MNFDWIKTRSDFDDAKPAVIDHTKHTEWTYQQLNARADNMAHYLTSQGIGKGDVVGIFAPNDVAILDLLFACFKMGAVFLPINWRLNPKEVAAIVDDSELKILFYAAKHLSSLNNVDQHLLHMDIDSQQYNDIVDPNHHEVFQATPVDPSDLAALIYTSGTTGSPKGVMFSYESFVHNGANLELTYKFNSNYVTIISTPMFHVLGFNDTVLPVLMTGGTLILQRYFNGEELNDMIAQYKPTFIIMIPTMYYSTLRASNFNPDNFKQMDYIIQGGSQPLPSIQQAFKQYGINIINGYGLTEAPLVLVNTPDNARRKPMSIGKAVMFVDARILDDSGEEVPNGEIGELAIKAKNVTPGYWHKPEETAKAFKNNYFLTGDLAKKDEDGDIFIIDRKKELIITGGENVLPSEVENVLAEHPLIDRCVVVGYEDPKYGESIAAAIILRQEDSDFITKLNQHMRDKLAGYKVPKMYLPVTHMPLNTTQKPDKIAISKMMNERAQQQDLHPS